ncbi:MAG: hypothetical protein ACD_79C01302G0002 [uncultured bacterium]|nr:MAG: hypothetical protein ACD_79C01302G0002 [uncultured bacterium]
MNCYNEEVFYPGSSIVKINKKDLILLKDKSMFNKRNRIRFCAHKDINDIIHEMFIIHVKGAYIRPHKHLNKIESFHIIQGEADVLIFDDNGNVIEVISMGDINTGKYFYYRLPDSIYHTLIIKSDFLFFHETTNGPFNKLKTQFPEWAPEEINTEEIQLFQKTIEKWVENK